VYQITFRRSAERDVRRLPADTRRRVVAAIEVLANNPRPAGAKRLEGDLSLWRIRVGAYRVVYTISDEGLEVLIVRARHRREAYRNL
jgi:mRNA interferase RelE/StbE